VSGAGATLRIENGSSSFLTVGDNIGSTGTLTIENGGLVSLAGGAKLTVGWNGAGTLNLNGGGTIEIGGTENGLQQGSGGTTVNLAGGTLRVGDGFTTSVPLALASTSTLNATTGAATFSGALTGPGGLVKTGAGKLTLGTANVYTGATTIGAGTLALGASGSFANTSGIDLAPGATFDVSAVSGYTLGEAQTLSGNGTIAGDVTVAGTLAPGASPGLLNFTGDLTLDLGSTLLFQLGGLDRGVTYDAVDVGGDLTFGGTIEFSLITGFVPVAGDMFHLFDVTGASTGAFSSVLFDQAGLAGIFDSVTGSLTITAVPEPATYALLAGLGVFLLAGFTRRRRAAR
jgi:autotransporter-associated beta strand protein